MAKTRITPAKAKRLVKAVMKDDRRIELHKLELFIRDELDASEARAYKLRNLHSTVRTLQKELK